VPLIARWPGTIEPGSVSHHRCASWDFFPTFAEMSGVQTPANLDGISMLPELTGGEQAEHEHLYWETGGGRRAVRMGDWKAVRPGEGAALELYDLRADVGEQNDLASENPEVLAEAEQLLVSCHVDAPQLEEPGWHEGPV
jgi:arylsulfatase A-like enzyme